MNAPLADDRVTKLYVSGANNSTKFTFCCVVAVIDSETKCPRCQALIEERQGKKP